MGWTYLLGRPFGVYPLIISDFPAPGGAIESNHTGSPGIFPVNDVANVVAIGAQSSISMYFSMFSLTCCHLTPFIYVKSSGSSGSGLFINSLRTVSGISLIAFSKIFLRVVFLPISITSRLCLNPLSRFSSATHKGIFEVTS